MCVLVCLYMHSKLSMLDTCWFDDADFRRPLCILIEGGRETGSIDAQITTSVCAHIYTRNHAPQIDHV
jgi:hypothetical protein